MKTEWVERSLYRWIEEEISFPEEFADALHLHRPGQLFPERFERWVFARISGFTRRGISRRNDEWDTMTLVVSCHVKNPPGGREDPFELSRIVDSIRLGVDAGERAGAFKVRDEHNRVVAVGDFGPAQEARSYNESVFVGGISVPGVDSAVLTVAVSLSPVRPRVKPLRMGEEQA